jgi:hypothetical protein
MCRHFGKCIRPARWNFRSRRKRPHDRETPLHLSAGRRELYLPALLPVDVSAMSRASTLLLGLFVLVALLIWVSVIEEDSLLVPACHSSVGERVYPDGHRESASECL